MQWSCPHCGTGLGVSDGKLGNGWSFSRCYKCGGYALVRRSEVNLVKVDRAPAGEPILLPESSEDPLMSQEATQRLSKYLKRRDSSPIPTPPQFKGPDGQAFPSPLPEVGEPTQEQPEKALAAPAPPVKPRPSTRQKLLPVGIGLAGALAIGSGVYLVIQGEALWEKTRPSSSFENEEPSESKKSLRKVSARRRHSETLVTDEVHQGAMAPTREPTATPPGAAPSPTTPAATTAPSAAAATAPATAAPPPTITPPTKPSASTTPPAGAATAATANAATATAATATAATATAANANAANAAVTDRSQQPTLVVQPKSASADIHSGPGSLYPRLGVANPKGRYLVADWNDRWFKIILAESRTGWIRTDLVQVVTARTEEKLPNDP